MIAMLESIKFRIDQSAKALWLVAFRRKIPVFGVEKFPLPAI
jgi:hypothetical protein